MKKLNLQVLVIPVLFVVLLGVLFSIFPEGSVNAINSARAFFNTYFSWWYVLFGAGIFLLLLFMSFSKLGNVKLGKEEDKPMKTFTWSCLIFTSTFAADLIFYSLHEWTYYWSANITDVADASSLSQKLLWSETYSFFHWTLIPWSIYLVLAVIYAYAFFRDGRRTRQCISEFCRPVLKNQTEKFTGKLIDVFSVIVLLLGTSTTFSVTTPLMSAIVCKLFNIQNQTWISVIILIVIAAIYTIAVCMKKGISIIAKVTTIAFACLVALFFVIGNPVFSIENGIQSLGNMAVNFFKLATWTDPARASGFVQDWTVFYWAYWIAWSVGTPIFIAKISKGRTIKQTLIGGLIAGSLGTMSSFISMSGFGLNLQASGAFDAASMIANGTAPADVIVSMIYTSKAWAFLLVVTFIVMCLLYASTFDALTSVVSAFSYKSLDVDEEPSKLIKIFWSMIFLILPIALLFLNTANQCLQSMSIFGALPFSIIIVIIIISFFKDAKQYFAKASIGGRK